MHDTDRIEAVMRYHKSTKHHFKRYSLGPGHLDWANQPNPFRRYKGAPLVHLPLLGAEPAPCSQRSMCFILSAKARRSARTTGRRFAHTLAESGDIAGAVGGAQG